MRVLAQLQSNIELFAPFYERHQDEIDETILAGSGSELAENFLELDRRYCAGDYVRRVREEFAVNLEFETTESEWVRMGK